MIRLVIFDLDGTLANAYPAVSSSVNYVLKELGFPRCSHAEIKRSVGFGDRQLMVSFVGEHLAEKAIRLYRPHHARALAAKGMVRFLPGALELLRTLENKGYSVAIASNRPTKFTVMILKVLGISKYFDMVLCADKAPKPKPAPDILRLILKRLKVPKKDAVYVGDMTIDVITGQTAKVRTVAVSTGSSTTKELKVLNPYRIISKIGQLKTIIKECANE